MGPDRLVTLPEGVPKLTLGWAAAKWAMTYLRQPNGPNAGKPWRPIESQLRFRLWWYAVDENGRWLFHHGVRRLAKGSGKSPDAAVLGLTEFLGPVRLDGFDPKAPGGCVGKPVSMPLVQIAATAESQTANTMRMVRAMATKTSKVAREYRLDVGKTVYYEPGGGQLEVITSSAAAAEGAEVTFAIEDETEHWNPSNGGPKLAEVLDRNLAKSGSRAIETANAWVPGDGSIAESTFDAWTAQMEGRTKGSSRILYDARTAPADVELGDEASLMRALEFVYEGCWWVDLSVIRDRIWDPRNKPETSRQFYLNQPTAATDSWLAQFEWKGCADATKVVADGEMVVLGFDGSRGRAKGKPDATALVGCRVGDGHLFELAVWEAGDEPSTWAKWEPPLPEIEAAVADAFRRFNVVGFYCDPAKDWRSYVNTWEATYGSRAKIKGSRDHPFEWWMTGGRSGLIQRAVEQFEGAVRNKDLTHDGSWALTRHVFNARRRIRHSKLTIGKESDYSPKKVDAAVAAVLAWQARLDAVAAGLATQTEFVMPRRLR
jgi:hypothetical protein